MRKLTAVGISLIFVFFSLSSCKKEAETPKAGSASVDDMLRLVPEDAMGVFFIDFHKAMSTEMVNKSIKESKEGYEKYQEFIQITGIDPQKDIYFVTVAITEATEKVKGGAIVNMKFEKEALLTLVKAKAAEEGQEITEEDYNGVPVYSVQEKGEVTPFTFLDDSNIIAGNDVVVRSIIDVLQKKKENVFKNKVLSDLIAKTNKSAMIWGAMLIPEEAMSKAASQNPMLGNLQSINAASMYFDYKNKNLIAEIKVMSSDEAKNKEVADLLNGVKAMGSMAAAQKPEIGELVNNIEITSTADHVKIYASIPEELINKLKEAK